MPKWWDYVKDVLTIAVIPVLAWAIWVQTTLAVQCEQLKDYADVKKAQQEQSERLVRVETKLDAAGQLLGAIREDVGAIKTKR